MKFSNPTQISVGMLATIAGKRYRVMGRAVLGETESWRTYYWNEYNLQSDDGHSATLVFEQTEHGPEWRFFTMFEPQTPITAADAATRQTGQMINLDGDNCYVSQKSRSQVYFVEGKAPEGESVGTTADYFNATRGMKMVVVSWTGEEVEFYRGMTLPSGVVAAAFNLTKTALLKFQLTHGWYHFNANSFVGLGLAALFVILSAILISDLRPPRRLPGVKTYNPPATTLAAADNVIHGGKTFHVMRHKLVEIAEQGQRTQRHEFMLSAVDGEGALLVHGVQPGSDDWVWFTPISPTDPLTPVRAAKVRTGVVVNVDNVAATVTELFRSRILKDDWSVTPPATNEIRYGFQGKDNATLLLVRWNTNEIAFHKGTKLTTREVKELLSLAAK